YPFFTMSRKPPLTESGEAVLLLLGRDVQSLFKGFCSKPSVQSLLFKALGFAPRFKSSAADPGSGGARRDRTDDLLLAKQALSQLSYGPVSSQFSQVRASQSGARHQELVGLERFELSTSRLSSARSNQLSYRPGKRGGRPNEERETKAAVSR